MKLTKEQVKEVVNLALEYNETIHQWRWGQSIFNALAALHPEVAETVRDTKVDPFHIDKNVDVCLKFITE